MRLILLLLSILLIKPISAQQITVVESDNYSPLSNVTVTSRDFKIVTNEKGQFNSKIFLNQRITIKHLNFKDKTITLNKFTDTIKRLRDTIKLSEVIIEGEPSNKSSLLGYYKTKSSYPLFYQYKGKKNAIIATLIESNSRNSYIEKIMISKRKEDKNTFFKVYLFEVGENNLPGDTIFSKVIHQKNLKKKDIIDISDEQIKMPQNGIFVGFQWLENNRNYEEYLFINFTNRVSRNNTFILFDRPEKEWKRFGSNDDYNNARFGVQIKYF
jgi:hypothetical protein